MPFSSTAYVLMLAGLVAVIGALLTSSKGPSRFQMLLLWVGLVLFLASLGAVLLRA